MRRRDVHARGQVPAAERHRRLQLAHDRRHDGPQAQRLLDRRVEQLVAARRAARPRTPASAAGWRDEPLERPGQRGRGRLVAGDEQRHQLVAQLLVGQRAAVLVARGEQQREARRRARPGPRARAWISACSSSSARRRAATNRAPRAARAGAPVRQRQRQHAPAAGDRVEHRAAAARRPLAAARARSTPNTARRITSSVIACMLGSTSNGRAARPARRSRARPPRASRRRRRASARRGTAAASAAAGAGARAPSSSSTEPRAEDRRRDDVARAGVQQVRVAGEDLLDGRRVGGDTTQRPVLGRSVKKSPHFAWQASRKRVGHSTKPRFMFSGPRSGRGGRPAGAASIATEKPTAVVCLRDAAAALKTLVGGTTPTCCRSSATTSACAWSSATTARRTRCSPTAAARLEDATGEPTRR